MGLRVKLSDFEKAGRQLYFLKYIQQPSSMNIENCHIWGEWALLYRGTVFSIVKKVLVHWCYGKSMEKDGGRQTFQLLQPKDQRKSSVLSSMKLRTSTISQEVDSLWFTSIPNVCYLTLLHWTYFKIYCLKRDLYSHLQTDKHHDRSRIGSVNRWRLLSPMHSVRPRATMGNGTSLQHWTWLTWQS